MYWIADREAGNIIEEFETREEAKKALAAYEAADKENEIYTPDFYEIVTVRNFEIFAWEYTEEAGGQWVDTYESVEAETAEEAIDSYRDAGIDLANGDEEAIETIKNMKFRAVGRA